MNARRRLLAAVAAAGLVLACEASPKDTTMTQTARGPFTVTMNRMAGEAFPDGTGLARFSLGKQYHGELAATATGEMLTASTAVDGSAAYVALERVEGTLQGRTGTFILQHLGTMGRGSQTLTITVVPDSGTGGLVGLDGRLSIDITDGKHVYAFEYSLPGS